MKSGFGEILTQLRDVGPMSRADLMRATGLSSAGVTKLTSQMDEAGLITEEQGTQEKTMGRPPLTIALSPKARSVLAVHLGAGRVHIAVSDLSLGLSHERMFDFDLTSPVSQVLAQAIDVAHDVIRSSKIPLGQYLGIGIGVPGGVDASHRINTNAIYTGWTDVPFAQAFEDALGLPVFVEHNATAIAFAEACYGACQSTESILYILLGKGIGGGFAQAGTEARRNPVEIGHIVVEPGGRDCRCGGEGCLEMFFSEEPLKQLTGQTGNDATDLIAGAMKTPDWPQLYGYILQALSTSVTLLAPQRIVLGGHLNDAPQAFLDDLRRDLPKRVMPQQRRNLRIERTSLVGPVGVRGAAAVGLEQFFYTSGPITASRTARSIARAPKGGHNECHQ